MTIRNLVTGMCPALLSNFTWLLVLFATCTLLASGCVSYPDCDTDDDCKEKSEYCFNAKCAQCRVDSHCTAGRKCVGGACEKLPGWCDGSSDCVGREKCRDNKCGPECLDPNDCGSNEECVNGSCQEKAECVVDADCPAGRKCVDGVCEQAAAVVDECDSLEPVYFDFDESALRADARESLRKHANCVQKRDQALRIEGHCDERGTEEYNLALGERRARGAKTYMGQLGAPRNKLSTLSYGESRPVRSGSSEESFQLNRRCEFEWR